MSNTKKRNPWAWIPTLYFAQGLPYVAVNVLTVIMYKRLGISNTDIALYTGWLYLPWVIKPFWSPFVDIIKTKRWWTVLMQWIIGIGLAAVAFSIPTPFFFQLTLAIFWLVGFASATHDIASDGFYMVALEEHQQAAYVGIRSTFYRVATIVGQGLLVIIAGMIESSTGLDPVTFEVEANPGIEAVDYRANYEIKEITLNENQKGIEQFVFSTTKVEIPTVAPETVQLTADSIVTDVPFSSFSKMMIDSIAKLNIENGFVMKEEAVAETKAVESKSHALEGFENWIRNTFGEEKREVKALQNNFAIVGVTLSQQPKEESRILIVTYKSGDQSIKLEQNKLSTRLEFNKDNWNKTAYLYLEVDNKLAKVTTADFQGTSGNIPMAWTIVFVVLSIFFLLVALYHGFILPRPSTDRSVNGGEKATAGEIVTGFINTFKTFFQKKQICVAMAFMLLYRLPEAQLIKIINPFFLDPVDKGGLGLTTGQVGLVYGTIGIIALTLGGIIGGICASKGGLKKWLWPMAFCISLNSLVYIVLSAYQPSASSFGGIVAICTGMFIDQFGYGFGFTAFMLYMMYFADGPYKTSHYAICTAFMALGMMLPGMWSGWLQELVGYNHFFIWTLLCCFATWIVTAMIKVDPSYGKKKTTEEKVEEENLIEDQEL
ncbi:MAG: MFS transporter [Muribaculaceae bacterium]|nr:MFS transporter [Muribaculaceae bacterium]